MARTAIPVHAFALSFPGMADPAPVAGDATNGNIVPNNGKTVLRAKNTNGSSTSRTVTFGVPNFRGHTVTGDSATLAAGATQWLGPFPTDTYSGSLLVNVDNAELQITAFTF